MNTSPISDQEFPILYLNTEELASQEKVVSFFKSSRHYQEMPLEEKWKYRKAVNELQLLINKIQNENLNEIETLGFNLPEVVQLLKIRKEMLIKK